MSDAPPPGAASSSTQSPHYVIVVDRKGNDIIGCMLQISKIYHEVFAHMLQQSGVGSDDLITFVKDFAAKEHARGWCVDPNCKYPKPPAI